MCEEHADLSVLKGLWVCGTTHKRGYPITPSKRALFRVASGDYPSW